MVFEKCLGSDEKLLVKPLEFFVIMAMDNPPFIDDFSIFFPFTWPV